MRNPIANGFYPFSESFLRKQINEFIYESKKRKTMGIVVPHAGYAFSGKVAGKTYSSVYDFGETVMLMGPNHTGLGEPVALSTEDWKTPLGIVKNDRRFERIIPVSEDAHEYEHSIEVQLPFLQSIMKYFRIIPISLSILSFSQIEDISEKLAHAGIFFIASSDFTHFGPNYGYMPVKKSDEQNLAYAKEMDMKAIDMICKLDAKKFYNFVNGNHMTVCGLVPITLLILICKKLGAKRGELVDFSTSYDVHPASSFVDYAGILIE